MIAELIPRVFSDRNAAHREHWQTESYAAHVALGSFYSAVIDALDAIVECYQGTFSRIVPDMTEYDESADIMEQLREHADWIESNRDAISNGSDAIGNLVDNLTAVYAKTIFLLGLK